MYNQFDTWNQGWGVAGEEDGPPAPVLRRGLNWGFKTSDDFKVLLCQLEGAWRERCFPCTDVQCKGLFLLRRGLNWGFKTSDDFKVLFSKCLRFTRRFELFSEMNHFRILPVYTPVGAMLGINFVGLNLGCTTSAERMGRQRRCCAADATGASRPLMTSRYCFQNAYGLHAVLNYSQR